MKFYSRYGKMCRYHFLDKVKKINSNDPTIYTIVNAEWIGNSNGFWEVFLEDNFGNRHSICGKLKKVSNEK